MINSTYKKYKPYQLIDLPNRQWPSKSIAMSPRWCSVDLRDGNQSLVTPMNSIEKQYMYDTLIEIGFKEIEVGFPAASQTDYDFVRLLIEKNKIPDDVTIQVLCQTREDLIRKTFESLEGAKNVIFHLYISTSTLQRRVVFGMNQKEMIKLVVAGTKILQKITKEYPKTNWQLQFSPESFSGTELSFSKEICEAVTEVWQPSNDKKIIINLPNTVEMTTPNIYADQVEWFHRNFQYREKTILSLHSHNDRGTGTAATELALMAGADRVEGTLLGNGERTGNVDIINLALNMHSQGINSNLDFSNLQKIIDCYKQCNKLPVHPRHPYAGELVFTAFSGSHQDAIKKGLDLMKKNNNKTWEVPYLIIDPEDLGCNYEALIRVNSQSGKGGITYVLEENYGLKLPRQLQIEFSKIIQNITDSNGLELTSSNIWEIFQNEYLNNKKPYYLLNYEIVGGKLTAQIRHDGMIETISGNGNGPIDAFVHAISINWGINLQIIDYTEHAINLGSNAVAVTYIQIETDNGQSVFGVGKDLDIVATSLKAIISAMNRLFIKNQTF